MLSNQMSTKSGQLHFELRSTSDSQRRVSLPIERASSLVVSAREAARVRLCDKIPERILEVERYLVGRIHDDTQAVPAESRIRIIAIPSIGIHFADNSIRRLLVEIPAACPIRSKDIRWAFSGAELFDVVSGEVKDILLCPSADDSMLKHYGVGSRSRVFRSITPIVLPPEVKRRSVATNRKLVDAKPGLERVKHISGARVAVIQALRHAGIRAGVESIRVQREPFHQGGSRAELFAEGTRFEKGRLWNVEISFKVPVEGPLLLGDGRFLGLGLMAPAIDVVPGVHAFTIEEGLSSQPKPIDIVRALRRAVMARVKYSDRAHERLAPFFTGHSEDGAPVRGTGSSHISFAFDPESRKLFIFAPHIVERRPPRLDELNYLRTLDVALEGFRELRAGNSGLLRISTTTNWEVGELSLVGHSRKWKSATPYVVTRHAKGSTAMEALVADVVAECRRLKLPEPKVEPRNLRGEPGIGLTGDVTLNFERFITGPLLLGRTRFLGGGLFRPI